MTLSAAFWICAVWCFLLVAWVGIADWAARRRQRKWFEREITRIDEWRRSV